MTQRTDTRHQTVFHLNDESVTLEFVEEKKIKFTLAADSGWHSPRHWHELYDGCYKIICLKGRLLLSFARFYVGSGNHLGGPGEYRIKPGDIHDWSSLDSDRELVVLLETDDEILYRNTSSAVLDAARFPFLSSTPFWVRLVYRLLSFAAQRWMIATMLWIQL
jgi:hypothetical protein